MNELYQRIITPSVHGLDTKNNNETNDLRWVWWCEMFFFFNNFYRISDMLNRAESAPACSLEMLMKTERVRAKEQQRRAVDEIANARYIDVSDLSYESRKRSSLRRGQSEHSHVNSANNQRCTRKKYHVCCIYTIWCAWPKLHKSWNFTPHLPASRSNVVVQKYIHTRPSAWIELYFFTRKFPIIHLKCQTYGKEYMYMRLERDETQLRIFLPFKFSISWESFKSFH